MKATVNYQVVLKLSLLSVIFGLLAITVNAQLFEKPTLSPNPTKSKKPPSISRPDEQTQPLSAREIANRVLPSTVMIITQDENGETVAQGSGFVYKSGLIATNLHVFDRATQAYIKFVGQDTAYKVEEVVGINPRRDLCVVRINETQGKPLSISNLTKNEIGEDVFVASNPKGLEGSFSKGIISAIRKNVGLIQIDAAISPGSSGGAVLNNRGEIIGMVVSSITTGQNLNFAIPIEYLTSLKLEFNEPITTAGALAFSGRQREKLKGFVKSVIETNADMEYSKNTDSYVEQSAILNREMIFNLDGDILLSKTYYKGNLTRKVEYVYDNEGFMRKWVRESDTTPFVETDSDTSKKIKEFSILESIKLANANRGFSRRTADGEVKAIYDNKGNLCEMTVYAPNSQREIAKQVYSYGRYGFVSEIKNYKTGNLNFVEKYTYETDEQGNWIKRISTTKYSEYADLGFVPDSVTYRKITYFDE